MSLFFIDPQIMLDRCSFYLYRQFAEIRLLKPKQFKFNSFKIIMIGTNHSRGKSIEFIIFVNLIKLTALEPLILI